MILNWSSSFFYQDCMIHLAERLAPKRLQPVYDSTSKRERRA